MEVIPISDERHPVGYFVSVTSKNSGFEIFSILDFFFLGDGTIRLRDVVILRISDGIASFQLWGTRGTVRGCCCVGPVAGFAW